MRSIATPQGNAASTMNIAGAGVRRGLAMRGSDPATTKTPTPIVRADMGDLYAAGDTLGGRRVTTLLPRGR